MDYELGRLDSRSFEQLVQDLAVKVIAPGVIVLGDGPDGGREAFFEGPIPYPSRDNGWDGSLAIQAKFRQLPQGNETDSTWALNLLESELKATFDKNSKRPKPTHYIFATNVSLSSVPVTGGKARAEAIAKKYSLKGFDLWDYARLRTFLDGDEDVRNAHAAFITSGDVLAELMNQLQLLPKAPDFDQLIANYLEKELLADQYANLEQAGRVAEEQIPISRVFVDLPMQRGEDSLILFDESHTFVEGEEGDEENEDLDPEEEPGFVGTVLELAAQRLDPDSQRAASHDQTSKQKGRLVLIGGPGQGKTTAGQFLCQLFRTSLLRARSGPLTEEAEMAMGLMESQCAEEGIPIPGVRRFPIRIALTDLSDALASSTGPNSLLEFMAELVSKKTVGKAVPPDLFGEWLGICPWLLVLDGLDEVPAASNRDAVLEAIQEFWVDATYANSDVLVVATTRPQGYNEEFSPALYEHVTLAPLAPELAQRYGARLAKARHPANEKRQQQIVSRLDEAAGNTSTANLMTSPLQVTIMATLLDRGGQPPEQRWSLFHDYYEVIYRRELEREVAAARVLGKHKPDIDAIHRRVGLILQAEGERGEHANARMSSERFASIVRERLTEEGHQEPELSTLEAEIIKAANDRLVFLVGLEAGKVGFEIRSLQEFMAAEALMDGNEESLTKRLRAIAGMTSWRNVFLFAAGRCFAERQHLRDTINTICAQLDDPGGDPLAPIVLPGSILAAELLTDGFVRGQPNYSRLLAEQALRLAPRPSSHQTLLDAYDDSLGKIYEDGLRRRLGEENDTRIGCISLLLRLSEEGHAWADQLLDAEIPATVDGLVEALEAQEADYGSDWPAYARDTAKPGWLSTRIDELGSGLGLSAISRRHRSLVTFRESLPDNPVVTTAVGLELWLGQRDNVRLEGASGFRLGAQPIESSLAENQQGLFEHSSREALPNAWAGVKAAGDFAAEPTAEMLANQLEVLAEQVPVEDWGTVENLSPWPMSTTVDAAGRDPARLRELAALARGGGLGDRPDWDRAEKRWFGKGVRLADLDYVPKAGAPFDDRIGELGFPVDDGAGIGRTFGQTRPAVELMHSWLKTGPEKAAGRLTDWIIFALEGDLLAEDRLPASEYVRYLLGDNGSLAHQPTYPPTYQLVLSLDWKDPFSPEEAAALDRLGRSLTQPDDGQQHALSGFFKFPLPPVELQRNWDAGRQSDGLFRILAIGLPDSEAPPLAHDPEIAARNPGAAGLLVLKGAWREEELASAIAATAEAWDAEPLWLEEAFEVIRSRQTEPLAERALRMIWSAVENLPLQPGEGRPLHPELEELGAAIVDRRAASLTEDSTWTSLGLFARPPAPDRGTET